MGHPRPAGRGGGREGARLQDQAGHRGLRHRRVQPEVQGVRQPLHQGVGGVHPPRRLLARPREPLHHLRDALHGVGVGAAQDHVGEGPPLQGLQGRPLLPALHDPAELPRALAGLPGRRQGSERLRPVRARGRARHLLPGLDHHALDAAGQRRAGGGPRNRLRQGAPAPPRGARNRASDPGDPRRGAARRARRRVRGPGEAALERPGRPQLPAALPVPRTRGRESILRGRGGLRRRRGGHRRRPHRRRLRHRRPPPLPGERHPRPAHGRPAGPLPARGREVRRACSSRTPTCRS